MQEEKRVVENTPPAAKKRKIRTSARRKVVGQGTNQLGSSIVINNSHQVCPTVHKLSMLADAVAHTMEDEENVEDGVLLSTFFSRLRRRETTLTPNIGKV